MASRDRGAVFKIESSRECVAEGYIFSDKEALARDDSKYGYDSYEQNFYLKPHHDFQKTVLTSFEDL